MTTPTIDRFASRSLAVGLAAAVTLAMLAGVNELAAPTAAGDDDAVMQIAQQQQEQRQGSAIGNTGDAPAGAVQRVVITGHRLRG